MDTFGLEDCEIVAETDLAVLVVSPDLEDLTDDGKLWIPKSAIHEDSEVFAKGDAGGPGIFIMKMWFAEKQGWF